MNDNEFIAKVITDSRPAPQPTTSNTAHILLWCGFGAWLVAVVVTAAITFNNNQGPAYTTPVIRERATPAPTPTVALPPRPTPTPIILTPRAQPAPTAVVALPRVVPAPAVRSYTTLDRQIPFEI